MATADAKAEALAHDLKTEGSGGSGDCVEIDLAPSARRGSLAQALSGLTQRLSNLASGLNEYPLARVSAAKAFADDKDTVTEPGKARLFFLACSYIWNGARGSASRGNGA